MHDEPLPVTAWSQLWSPKDFTWVYGVTPFTSRNTIITAWALYFSTILILKRYMRDRAAFTLRKATALHNLFLCLTSFFIFAGVIRYTHARAQTRGIDEVFCTTDTTSLSGPLTWFLYIYYLSKFYELLDTVILVLKKKPVIFLHWYHHAIVIVMVWSWLQYGIVFSVLGTIANAGVHVFMYYYYFRTSLGGKVWFKRYLTGLQIVQFSASFILSIPYVYYHLTKGCGGGPAFIFSMAVNASFLVLFINFYKGAYGKSKTPAVGPAKKKAS
ncbi:ELO family [Powellomyces hirtus]|nr:ELO family [Powellomyces hirtus]